MLSEGLVDLINHLLETNSLEQFNKLFEPNFEQQTENVVKTEINDTNHKEFQQILGTILSDISSEDGKRRNFDDVTAEELFERISKKLGIMEKHASQKKNQKKAETLIGSFASLLEDNTIQSMCDFLKKLKDFKEFSHEHLQLFLILLQVSAFDKEKALRFVEIGGESFFDDFISKALTFTSKPVQFPLELAETPKEAVKMLSDCLLSMEDGKQYLCAIFVCKWFKNLIRQYRQTFIDTYVAVITEKRKTDFMKKKKKEQVLEQKKREFEKKMKARQAQLALEDKSLLEKKLAKKKTKSPTLDDIDGEEQRDGDEDDDDFVDDGKDLFDVQKEEEELQKEQEEIEKLEKSLKKSDEDDEDEAEDDEEVDGDSASKESDSSKKLAGGKDDDGFVEENEHKQIGAVKPFLYSKKFLSCFINLAMRVTTFYRSITIAQKSHVKFLKERSQGNNTLEIDDETAKKCLKKIFFISSIVFAIDNEIIQSLSIWADTTYNYARKENLIVLFVKSGVHSWFMESFKLVALDFTQPQPFGASKLSQQLILPPEMDNRLYQQVGRMFELSIFIFSVPAPLKLLDESGFNNSFINFFLTFSRIDPEASQKIRAFQTQQKNLPKKERYENLTEKEKKDSGIELPPMPKTLFDLSVALIGPHCLTVMISRFPKLAIKIFSQYAIESSEFESNIDEKAEEDGKEKKEKKYHVNNYVLDRFIHLGSMKNTKDLSFGEITDKINACALSAAISLIDAACPTLNDDPHHPHNHKHLKKDLIVSLLDQFDFISFFSKQISPFSAAELKNIDIGMPYLMRFLGIMGNKVICDKLPIDDAKANGGNNDINATVSAAMRLFLEKSAILRGSHFVAQDAVALGNQKYPSAGNSGKNPKKRGKKGEENDENDENNENGNANRPTEAQIFFLQFLFPATISFISSFFENMKELNDQAAIMKLAELTEKNDYVSVALQQTDMFQKQRVETKITPFHIMILLGVLVFIIIVVPLIFHWKKKLGK